ncbi:response regulator transcription factor [Gordoniibacillus kamchatkensis]|uniref:response regulator transcription factor n=1 Tax=Gordoniibacillus kamchatkensis TaxID=1590651 RepID=UPI001E488B9F|nr:response regulator [Paenibacillus sp. VKM B-2647]
MLIADDEEHVREGIELAVDWAEFGPLELLFAEDGQQAIELIRAHKPAVLFCDMNMPGMDGMTLLNIIREEGWNTQIIVVSGYDDFVYTRATIKANAVDYILKPFRKQDLEQALERAISAWRKLENSQLHSWETENRLKRADAILYEQKLAMYFKGEAPFHDGIRTALGKVGLAGSGIRAAMLLLRNRTELVERRFYGDAELFFFAANNIAQEILREYGAYYLCRLDDYQWLLLTVEGGRADSADRHKRYTGKVVSAWESTVGFRTLTGICEFAADADKLPASIGAARAALLKCELLSPAETSRPVKELPSLADQSLLMRTALKNADKRYAAEIVRSFAEALRQRGSLQLKDLQACTIEANLLLNQMRRVHSNENDSADLFIPLWISDLKEWENMLVGQLWSLIEEGGGDGFEGRGIQAVKDYIHRHFQEDISLSALSERFHFSPQYIAKKFKELYGTTVVTFLTEVRMEKARSLLRHTDIPVAELAQQLGYADENYFGKVFKKHTGLSPLQFRKQPRDS